MTPEEVLLGAIVVLDRDGWFQGDLYEGPPDLDEEVEHDEEEHDAWAAADDEAARTAPVCALGAIDRAAFGTAKASFGLSDPVNTWREARDRLIRAVGSMNVGTWNDTPGRTVDEVRDALRRAADADT